jgi:hypothetical protein
VAASVEELAFDLALDSLDVQRDVLTDIRARSATLLTASSIATSFVGGRAIDAVGLDPFTGAAIVAFFLTLVAPTEPPTRQAGALVSPHRVRRVDPRSDPVPRRPRPRLICMAKPKGTKNKPLKLSPDIWIVTGVNGLEKT